MLINPSDIIILLGEKTNGEVDGRFKQRTQQIVPGRIYSHDHACAIVAIIPDVPKKLFVRESTAGIFLGADSRIHSINSRTYNCGYKRQDGQGIWYSGSVNVNLFADDRQNKLISDAKDYIAKLFEGHSDGHDLDHSLRVFSNAVVIARKESTCDLEAVALAALLHDTDDHKLFDTVNNQNARTFLESHDVDSEKIDFICTIINSVSFSKNRGKTPDSLEGKIVQDADRLDAMGAIGIARTFAYGGKHGRPLDGGIEHFHEKLLLLKDEMNTQTARELAESRNAFLEEFLAHYEEENNVEI